MTERALRQKIRAEQTSRPNWCRPLKRLALYIRDGFRCAYCGEDLRDAAPAEMGLDHLTPWTRGGSNDPSNLVTCCRSCNSSRKDRPWREFATGGAVERILKLRRRRLNVALARAILAGEAEWCD